jgi:hypothetical protein
MATPSQQPTTPAAAALPQQRSTFRTTFKLAKQRGIPAGTNCNDIRVVSVEKWQQPSSAGDAGTVEPLLSVAEWARNTLVTSNADMLVKIARRDPEIEKEGTGVVHVIFGNGYEAIVGINAKSKDFEQDINHLNKIGVAVCVASSEGREDDNATKLLNEIGTVSPADTLFQHLLAPMEAGATEASLRIYMHSLVRPWTMIDESIERMVIFNIVTSRKDPYEMVRMEHLKSFERGLKSTGRLVEVAAVVKAAVAAPPVEAAKASAVMVPPKAAASKKRKASVLSPPNTHTKQVNAFTQDEESILKEAFGRGSQGALVAFTEAEMSVLKAAFAVENSGSNKKQKGVNEKSDNVATSKKAKNKTPKKKPSTTASSTKSTTPKEAVIKTITPKKATQSEPSKKNTPSSKSKKGKAIATPEAATKEALADKTWESNSLEKPAPPSSPKKSPSKAKPTTPKKTPQKQATSPKKAAATPSAESHASPSKSSKKRKKSKKKQSESSPKTN